MVWDEACMVTNHIEMPTILNFPPETTVEISFNFVSVLSVLGIFHVKLELFRSMAWIRNFSFTPNLNTSGAFVFYICDNFKIKIQRFYIFGFWFLKGTLARARNWLKIAICRKQARLVKINFEFSISAHKNVFILNQF